MNLLGRRLVIRLIRKDGDELQLNEVTFHLSHSFAPNVLNGVLINGTRYAIMSNVRAPILEDGVSPQEKMVSIAIVGPFYLIN